MPSNLQQDQRVKPCLLWWIPCTPKLHQHLTWKEPSWYPLATFLQRVDDWDPPRLDKVNCYTSASTGTWNPVILNSTVYRWNENENLCNFISIIGVHQTGFVVQPIKFRKLCSRKEIENPHFYTLVHLEKQMMDFKEKKNLRNLNISMLFNHQRNSHPSPNPSWQGNNRK